MGLRIAATLVSAALDKDRPLIANLIVTRRCNLSCGYCYEYDKVSPAVPLDVLKERVDHIARLRTVFVTLTGGESLLNPDTDKVVAYQHLNAKKPCAAMSRGLCATCKRLDGWRDQTGELHAPLVQIRRAA